MKIELTADQRLKYYNHAKNTFRSVHEGPYICLVLKWALVEAGVLTNTSVSPEEFCRATFPEFSEVLAQTLSELNVWLIPDNAFGNEVREVMLDKCIKILKDAIQTY